MNGIIRCDSIISYNENDNEVYHWEVIYSSEYHSEYELIKNIGREYIDKSLIEIVE